MRRIRTSVERLSPLLERLIVRNLTSLDRETFEVGLLQVERFYRDMRPSKAIARRLCAVLRSGRADFRERTASTFATIGGNAYSLRCLIMALRDSRPGVRDYVCQALGKSGLPAAVPHLRKALADPDEQVRFSTLGALAELNASPSRKELLHYATESSELVRLAAVQSMTQVATATRRARAWVLEFFWRRLEQEKDELVRCDLFEGLYRFTEGRTGLKQLKALAASGNGIVRWRVYETLRHLADCRNANKVWTILNEAARRERSMRARRHVQELREEVRETFFNRMKRGR